MGWTVNIKKKVKKSLRDLPDSVQEDLQDLIADMMATGPVRGDWQNYSKLADGSHHCHLNYRYVAVWEETTDGLKIIEVTYVGSREGAPY